MNIKDLVFDVEKTMGNVLRLVGIRDKYKYADGVRTTEVVGTYIDIVLENRRFIRASVAVPSSGVNLTDEDVTKGSPVVFDNLKINLYNIKGETRVSIKADVVRVATSGKKSSA